MRQLWMTCAGSIIQTFLPNFTIAMNCEIEIVNACMFNPTGDIQRESDTNATPEYILSRWSECS